MQLKEKWLCTAYLGSTQYFSELLNANKVVIEAHENFSKQTLRNRTFILGPNGPQMLNIPVLKGEGKQKITDVRISYAEDWQTLHWRSLQTAYGAAPFFEVLAPELLPFYQKQEPFLFDFNKKLTQLMLNWLQADIELKHSSVFELPVQNEIDKRFAFNAKNQVHENAITYFQLNNKKGEFTPNLSIIDLMFNEGPMAWEILKQSHA